MPIRTTFWNNKKLFSLEIYFRISQIYISEKSWRPFSKKVLVRRTGAYRHKKALTITIMHPYSLRQKNSNSVGLSKTAELNLEFLDIELNKEKFINRTGT